MGWYFFVAVLVMVVFVAFGAGNWKKEGVAVKGTLILFLGGFSGIAAETVLMYLYQSGFGYLYSRIALLLAFFMVGMALGALIRWGHPFRTAWLWVGYFLVVTIAVGYMMETSRGRSSPEWFGLIVYLLLITGAGLLTGVSFKAGSSLLEEAGVRHPGGMAYGVDIFGAALGTVVCGLVLPLAIGLFAPIRYCLLLSIAIAAGISIGSAKN